MVRYVQLAHNRRVGSSVVAEVLVNLGREDRLDLEGLRRLAASITRYTDGGGAGVGVDGGELEVVRSRPLGSAWLLDALWRRLGIDRALADALGGRRYRTDVERVLFAMVANRAIAPSSKLAAAEWVSEDAWIPGLEATDKDQCYRAMDVLLDADAQGRVQEAVFFACADLLNLEVDVLFFDTTSSYFEVEDEDPGPEGLRRFGHSKDHRPDRVQVLIGLAVTREGIPVRCWVWPGNTADQSVVKQVKDDLAGWRLGRAVWVVDRGFSSEENLRYLTRGGGHWIAGRRLRDNTPDAQAALARQGRYRTVRENLQVKEVQLAADALPGVRYIVCLNPAEAERDRTQRERQLTTIAAELERIEAMRAKKNANKREVATHVKAECALRDHPTLGRLLRQTTAGRLRVDQAKVQAEERLDGKFLIATSDPDLTPEDIALGYKNLLEAERSFRDMKGTLELRPVYHRLEERIRAHILLCWLALLLLRTAENQTGQTWRRIRTELQRLHLVTLQGPTGTVEQTTKLTPAQHDILTALEITPPPRITSLEPA